MTGTFVVVKRLVVVVVALNVVMAGLLLAAILIDHGNGSAEVEAAGADSSAATETTTTVATETAPPAVESDTGDDANASGEGEPAADGDVIDDEPANDDPQADDAPVLAAFPPPYPDPFEPTANEVQPDAKRFATSVAYMVTNYDVDATLDDVLAMLPPHPDEMALGTATEVDILHHPDMWSRGTVEYAQLGGHLDGRISLIIVIRQEIGVEGSGEPERVETRTMEVRLARTEAGGWGLETIASAGGQPVARPADLSPTAAAVVDHDRIDLPDTGVWDIYAGLIDRQLLEVMLDLADRTSYSVVVLQAGHAYNVFGTNRVSNHSVGRAVDIYKFDTQLVIDAHDSASPVHELSEWVVSRYDIREFGSPWKFPDAVAHTFTNEVHHDHVHIGVNSYPSSPDPPPAPEPAPEPTVAP